MRSARAEGHALVDLPRGRLVHLTFELRRGTVYWSAAPSPVPTGPARQISGHLPRPARDAMAPPDGAAVSDNAMGLTQRELLMEMREDITGLTVTVDAIAGPGALRRNERTRRHCGERA